MNQIVNIPPSPQNKERIVIIGGGFAGLELAKKIDKKRYQIVLLDKNNYHQFHPLLYQVAMGVLDTSSLCYPLRKNFQNEKNVHFRMCKATHIYSQEKRVETVIGDIYYDHLVIAIGSDTNYFGDDSLRESTFALKSISEAILVRNRILLSLEKAVNITDKEERRKVLCFTIVGGGATGVELAGALADMRRLVLPKDYPEIDFDDVTIHLIDGSPRLLGGLSLNSSTAAANTLEKRGVILHLGVLVAEYSQSVLKLSNNTELYSNNVFWVGGVKANNIAGLDDTAYIKGRLVVDEYNEVKGYPNIYAIGDNSLLLTDSKPNGHPQVAQVALQMARLVAKNLNNKPKGKSPEKFVYNDKGLLATIGRNAAVADIGRLHFSGFFAWWIWLFIHIMSMIGIRNKLLVFIDWAWSYFGFGLSLRLFIRPKMSKIYDEE